MVSKVKPVYQQMTLFPESELFTGVTPERQSFSRTMTRESLALTREVNLATPSSASSAEEIRESGSAFQSLMAWGKKLHL